MYVNVQRRNESAVQDLRREGGRWLKELREASGLSQRELALAIGAEYYTFISQVELGRGRVPPDKYKVWAGAIGMNVREFVVGLMRYYEPVTHEILFGSKGP